MAIGCGRGAGLVVLFDVESKKEVERVETGTCVNGLLFSKTTKELLTCHGAPYNQLTLWQCAAGSRLRVVAELFAHTGPVAQVVLVGSTRVASLSTDETLRHWEVFPERKGEEEPKKSPSGKALSLR